MKIVIKIGGAALEDKPTLARCVATVAGLARQGHRVALVHGGGKALTQLLQQLGRSSEFVHGLRVTDADTRDAAVMVLAGLLNKALVAEIAKTGLDAIGLCGGDGSIFRAEKRITPGLDLGFVGEICRVETRWLEVIWEQGGIPVLSSLALGMDGEYYNVNADQAAAACAIACHADQLVFLTDVSGVKDTTGAVLPLVSQAQIEALAASAVIGGGMLPKLDACKNAAAQGVGPVRILPAGEAQVLLQSAFSGVPLGTAVVCA